MSCVACEDVLSTGSVPRGWIKSRAAAAPFKRTPQAQAYKGQNGSRYHLQCNYIKGRLKQRYFGCSAVVYDCYDSKEDTLKESPRDGDSVG